MIKAEKQKDSTLKILLIRMLLQTRLDMDENVDGERQLLLYGFFNLCGKFMAFVHGKIGIDMNVDIDE